MRAMRARVVLVTLLSALAAPLACIPGYGFVDGDAAVDGGGNVGIDAQQDSPLAADSDAHDAGADGTFLVDNVDGAGCQIVTSSPTDLGSAHIDAATQVAYSSEPASSGPHDESWAAFVEFPAAVEPRFYVHSLEHGAVVYAYRCPTNVSCGPLLAAIRQAIAAMPDDPTCNKDAGSRVRAVMMPDPALDVPIGIAAWGKLYKANCIDLPSMQHFATDNYAKGPENRCDQGRYTF